MSVVALPRLLRIVAVQHETPPGDALELGGIPWHPLFRVFNEDAYLVELDLLVFLRL